MPDTSRAQEGNIFTQVAVLGETIKNVKTLVETQTVNTNQQFAELKGLLVRMQDGSVTKEALTALEKQLLLEVGNLSARLTILESNQTWGSRNLIMTLVGVLVSIGLAVFSMVIAINKV